MALCLSAVLSSTQTLGRSERRLLAALFSLIGLVRRPTPQPPWYLTSPRMTPSPLKEVVQPLLPHPGMSGVGAGGAEVGIVPAVPA